MKQELVLSARVPRRVITPEEYQAWEVVREAHGATFRGSNRDARDGEETTVQHVWRVWRFSTCLTSDISTALAALWHDAVEDTKVTLQIIARHSGDEVAAIVANVTDLPEWRGMPDADRKLLQFERLRTVSHRGPVCTVKYCDQIDNLRTLAKQQFLETLCRERPAWTKPYALAYVTGCSLLAEACIPAVAAHTGASEDKLEGILESALNSAQRSIEKTCRA